ncbi:MAG: HEPN domain-containing protein [Ignavibacteriae bacterium]|nr:HEPN domain-containing protein [Ignavibacteriota bacterium]
MKAEAREWLLKADRDVHTATREHAVEIDPNFDAVCFHCQQAVEKMMKALIVEQEMHVLRTHDLTALLEILLAVYPEFEELREHLARLTDYSIGYRYPGMDADAEMADEAYADASTIYAIFRSVFERL